MEGVRALMTSKDVDNAMSCLLMMHGDIEWINAWIIIIIIIKRDDFQFNRFHRIFEFLY